MRGGVEKKTAGERRRGEVRGMSTKRKYNATSSQVMHLMDILLNSIRIVAIRSKTN